jgi:6-phosphogluconate dehydrogenase
MKHYSHNILIQFYCLHCFSKMDVKLDIPVDDTHGNIMVDFVSAKQQQLTACLWYSSYSLCVCLCVCVVQLTVCSRSDEDMREDRPRAQEEVQRRHDAQDIRHACAQELFLESLRACGVLYEQQCDGHGRRQSCG